jgi:uncharacterized protein YbaR (Trm112 family)
MTQKQRDPFPAPEVKDEHRVDPKLLEMLACPLTKGTLSWDPVHRELISRSARLAYPVRDGVPIMLPSEARTLGPDELE